MKTIWEYWIIDLERGGELKLDDLIKLGSQGWELVLVNEFVLRLDPGFKQAVFKRPFTVTGLAST